MGNDRKVKFKGAMLCFENVVTVSQLVNQSTIVLKRLAKVDKRQILTNP